MEVAFFDTFGLFCIT